MDPFAWSTELNDENLRRFLIEYSPGVIDADWRVDVYGDGTEVSITWWGGPFREEVERELRTAWPALEKVELCRYPRLSEAKEAVAIMEAVWGITLPLDDEFESQDLGTVPVGWWLLPVGERELQQVFADVCEGAEPALPPSAKDLKTWRISEDVAIRDAALLLAGRADT